MSLFVTIAADILVGILLVGTILTSVKLSQRIRGLKADEAAMRQTIGDLVVASATAERAIAGLRAALSECDRGLSAHLDAAEKAALELAAHVEAGEGVVAKISAIVAQSTRSPSAHRDPIVAAPMPAPRVVPPPPVSNGERLDAARAAAQAMAERALDRLRARAA